MSGPEQYPLPSAAQGRLHHSTQGGSAATSFLAYSDYLQLDQLGFEPLGGVIGLSVMHLGRIQVAGLWQAVELDGYSQGISMGILTALGRLQDEAAMLGADGVLLHGGIGERRFDAEEHEYSVQGTALRFRTQPGALRTPSGRPFVFGSSVQVLYQMLKRDQVPIGYSLGVCVYHVPHRTIRQSLGQTFQNVEIPLFTDAWYTCRELALSRLQLALEQNGASLVLNMKVSEQPEAFGEHTAEFRAYGSGWARREGIGQLVPTLDQTPAALIDKGVYVTEANPTTSADPAPPPGIDTRHRADPGI